MPTISPWADRFTRPALERHTREFKLPDGNTIKITLEELDELGEGQAQDLCQDYIQRYVVAPKGKVSETPLPNGRGTLRASRSICFPVAYLVMMQKPGPEGDEWPEGEWAYSFLDWVGVIQNWPDTWREIRAFADEVMGRAQAAGGEAAEDDDPNA